jgi:hypothetical protein
MKPKQIWALAYYVHSLTELRGTKDGIALKETVRADTAALVEPVPEGEEDTGAETDAPPVPAE